VPEYVVAGVWAGTVRGPSVLVVENEVLVRIEPADATRPQVPLTVMPGVVDRHVHLCLVDHAALAGGAVVEVHDLGGVPDDVRALRETPPSGVTVRIAGPFHTAPGGYPSGRPWAPEAAVRAVGSVGDANGAVADAVRFGYDVLKIALHADMPLLEDQVLRALVTAAHDVGLAVAVHAEGDGQAGRAIDAGADVLVHAPWTESLPDEVLTRGRHMTWYSTLAIHAEDDRATAIDNLSRFRAVGGRVAYGTDMGNGPMPVGVNQDEILALGAAGLEGDELLRAVTGDLGDELRVDRLLVSPHRLPRTAPDTVSWLADANRLAAEHLMEHDVAR
jgi:hypothetical protein